MVYHDDPRATTNGRFNGLIVLWFIAFASAAMSRSLIALLRGLLDWLDKLPPGRQTLATGAILAATTAFCGGIWFILTSAIAGTRAKLRAKREATRRRS